MRDHLKMKTIEQSFRMISYEPRYTYGPRDWQNMFAVSSFPLASFGAILSIKIFGVRFENYMVSN